MDKGIMSHTALPDGRRVVVTEFGDDPMQALENHLEIVPQPAPDPATLAATDVIIAIKSAAVGWVVQKPAGESYTLRDVFFYDAMTGWAVGTGGNILATSNGGATWTPQGSGTTDDLFAIHFTSAQQGWIAGANGTVLTTNNGGAIWASKRTGVLYELRGVYFADSDTGCVAGVGNVVRTQDGGDSWTEITTGAKPLFNMHFANADTGWAVGSDGGIFATFDGGASWDAQTSNTVKDIYGVHAVAPSTVWAGGDDMVRTLDGQAWGPAVQKPSDQNLDLFFVTVDTGWVASTGGNIYKTTDAAVSWQTQSIPMSGAVFGLYFLNADTGWAVGENGMIVHTVDGGG